MRLPTILLLLLFYHASPAQEAPADAAQRLEHLVKAAYAKEAALKEAIGETRRQIRQQLTSAALRDTFDAVFSDILSGNQKKKSFPTVLYPVISKVITLDVFTQMLNDLQKITQQNSNFKYLGKKTDEGILFNDTSYIAQQLIFFNLQNQDKVGELGAGSGWMAFLIGTLYDSVQIQINEISLGMVRRFESEMAYKLTPSQQKRFRAVFGTAQSTGMEGENLDVILAIDAFHHFADKISMLQSIRWSLSKQGRLILVEQNKDYESLSDYCPTAMEQWELEELLKQNGFVKVREQPLYRRSRQKVVMLEYAVNPL